MSLSYLRRQPTKIVVAAALLRVVAKVAMIMAVQRIIRLTMWVLWILGSQGFMQEHWSQDYLEYIGA